MLLRNGGGKLKYQMILVETVCYNLIVYVNHAATNCFSLLAGRTLMSSL